MTFSTYHQCCSLPAAASRPFGCGGVADVGGEDQHGLGGAGELLAAAAEGELTGAEGQVDQQRDCGESAFGRSVTPLEHLSG
jgi:hypothetical protein